MKKRDPRPICYCSAYHFPHKIGGKCTGQVFVEFHFYNVRECCEQCNCFNDHDYSCDVATGLESIKHAECYMDRLHHYPSERLPLTFIEEEE